MDLVSFQEWAQQAWTSLGNASGAQPNLIEVLIVSAIAVLVFLRKALFQGVRWLWNKVRGNDESITPEKREVYREILVKLIGIKEILDHRQAKLIHIGDLHASEIFLESCEIDEGPRLHTLIREAYELPRRYSDLVSDPMKGLMDELWEVQQSTTATEDRDIMKTRKHERVFAAFAKIYPAANEQAFKDLRLSKRGTWIGHAAKRPGG